MLKFLFIIFIWIIYDVYFVYIRCSINYKYIYEDLVYISEGGSYIFIVRVYSVYYFFNIEWNGYWNIIGYE